MTKFYTERQMEMPSKRDILNVLAKRQAIDPKQRMELDILERKHHIFSHMLDIIDQNGTEDWSVLSEISLRVLANAECDFILVNKIGSWFFQIYDPRIMPLNQAVQNTYEIHRAYTEFFERVSVPFSLNGFIVVPDAIFPHIFQTQDDSIQVIPESNLEPFLVELADNERNSSDLTTDIRETFHWLNEIDSKSGFMSVYISEELEEKIQGGLLCKSCGSFEMMRQDDEVVCACGQTENIEEALQRAIADYTIIYPEEKLKPLNLHHALWQERKMYEYQELIDILNSNYRALSYSQHKMVP